MHVPHTFEEDGKTLVQDGRAFWMYDSTAFHFPRFWLYIVYAFFMPGRPNHPLPNVQSLGSRYSNYSNAGFSWGG
jgi:hypothetical protein